VAIIFTSLQFSYQVYDSQKNSDSQSSVGIVIAKSTVVVFVCYWQQ